MSIANVYTRQFHSQTKHYYATWLPTDRIALGLYGTVDGGFFQPFGSIDQLGIDFDVAANTNDSAGTSPMKFTSSEGVSFQFKAAGETKAELSSIATAKAGISIEFSRQGAFVLEAKRMRERRMNITPNLSLQILDAFKEGRWAKNYAIVWSVLEASYADILIAESAGAGIELEANGDVAELGNVEAGLSVKQLKGSVLKYGPANLTPAFKLMAVQKRFFRPAAVVVQKRERALRWDSAALGPKDLMIEPKPEPQRHDPLDQLYLGELIAD